MSEENTGEVYEAIVEASIAVAAEGSVFEKVRDNAIGKNVELFINDCLIAESDWMGDKFGDVPDARKWEVSNGKITKFVNGEKGLHSAKDKGFHPTGAYKWKFRSYLPGPYTSAKSVIKKALEQGVDVTGLGKSEITALTKAKGEEAKEISPPSSWEKVQKAMRVIDSQVEGLSTSEAEELQDWASKLNAPI